MDVFLTGATGFIGRYVVPRLAETGHSLRCLVRPTSDTRPLTDAGATLITGDINDRAALRAGMEGCDCVIHLAGTYSFWEPDTRLYTHVNVDGTRSVMECALEAGVARVVHMSSAVIYGRPTARPFHEETPIGPGRCTPYARTKYAGEQIVWELFHKRSLPVVMLYPGMVIGPGEAGPVGQYIHDLIHRRIPALLFGDTVFTAIHVGDVAEAVVRAAEKEGASGERYLLGTESLSWRTFTDMICSLAGVPPPRALLPGALVWPMAAALTWMADRMKRPPLWGISTQSMRHLREGFWYDGEKAERELGITCRPIRAAIEEAVAAHCANLLPAQPTA